MQRPNNVGWFLVALFGAGGALFIIFLREVWLLGAIWIVVAAGLAGLYTWMNKRADRAEKLEHEGIPGNARILEMTQTGAYVNQNPRVRLKLRIEAPGVETFEVKHTYTVPMIGLGGLAVGGTLPVYLDRRDTSRFAIHWGGGDESGTPHDRLEELTDLRDSGLISNEEFEEHKEQILDAI